MIPLPRCLLLSRPDRIGDVVVTSSCLQPVRDQLPPDAKLFLLVRSPLAGLFENNPALDGIIALADHTTAGDLADIFRQYNFDAVAHLHESPIVLAAGALAKTPCQISAGTAKKNDPQNLRRLLINKKSGNCHEAEYNFKMLEALGFKTPAPPLVPQLTPDPRAKKELAENAPQLFAAGNALPYVVFHCGAHGKKLRLPAELFFAAARTVKTIIPAAQIVVIGDAQPDSGADEFIRKATGGKTSVIDLRGKLSLAGSAWLLASAALCFSRDSGPAHLAAAMGCRTLTVFIENTPAMGPIRWTPLGKNSHALVTPAKPFFWEPFPFYRRRALRAISSDEICAKIAEILRSPPRADK